VFIIAPDGDFLYINDACLRMIGSPGREISMAYNAFTLPTIKSVGLDKLLRRCLDGEAIEREVEYVSMFGKPASARLTGIPLRDEDDRVLAAACLIQLLEEQRQNQQTIKRLSDELATTRMELKEFDRLRKRFVAIVSHELRTPLSPLIGYLQMLEDESLGPLTENQRKALGVAHRNAARLLKLVEKVLRLSSQEKLPRPKNLKPVETAPLLRDALESMAPLMQEGELQAEVDCPDEVPLVIGDRGMLGQALMTLLDNARKFTPPGGRVRIAANPLEDGRVAIEVANTGQPIPPEDRERIFEPFYQVENPRTRRHGGIGLGLAIARESIIAQRGTIEAVDREGFDAAIRVVLPGLDTARDAGEISESNEICFRLLVVDHDQQRRQQIAEMLDDKYYDLRHAQDIKQALGILEEWPPNAVILGVDDPAQANYRLIGAIRKGEQRRFLPIYTVTSDTEPQHKRMILDEGATAVIYQPLDATYLQRLLSSVYPTFF
jgi:signal transduction histidine kinase